MTKNYSTQMCEAFGLVAAKTSSGPTPEWVTGNRVASTSAWAFYRQTQRCSDVWDHVRQWKRGEDRIVTSEPYNLKGRTPDEIRDLVAGSLVGLPGLAADVYPTGGHWNEATSLIVIRPVHAAPLAPGAFMSIPSTQTPDTIAVCSETSGVIGQASNGTWFAVKSALMPWVKPRRISAAEFALGVPCQRHGVEIGVGCKPLCASRRMAARHTASETETEAEQVKRMAEHHLSLLADASPALLRLIADALGHEAFRRNANGDVIAGL